MPLAPCVPAAVHGQTAPVQRQINDRGGVEGEDLADQQPAHDGDAQGLAQLGAVARAQGQRHGAQHGGKGGHENGAQALHAGIADRGARVRALALGGHGKVDHEDGILLHDTNEQDDADQGDDAEIGAGGKQRQQGAQARRGQRGQNRDGMHRIFIQHAQHDVDGEQGGEHEVGLAAQGLLEHLGAALEAIDELNLAGQMTLVGLAKNEEELFFPGDQQSLKLSWDSEGLKLIRRIRDEVHRFGITFHRQQRSKGTFKNSLEDIKGIGTNSANLLLKTFKSVNNIRKQPEAELAKWVGASKARLVREYFEKEGE